LFGGRSSQADKVKTAAKLKTARTECFREYLAKEDIISVRFVDYLNLGAGLADKSTVLP
jgi:hypothetical protein